MKKIFVAMLFALIVSATWAQTDLTFWDASKPDQQWTIGPRVGLNVAKTSWDIKNMPNYPNSDSKIGFNLGVEVDYAIFSSLYINSGLFFTTKGLKWEHVQDERYGDILRCKWNMSYLQLPIYASYRLNFASDSQLQVNFGPYFACGLGGKYKYEKGDSNLGQNAQLEFTEIEGNLFGKKDGSYDLKRIDVGLGIGAGYTFSKIYVGLAYEMGLVNLSKYWDVKNRNLNISVGYNF